MSWRSPYKIYHKILVIHLPLYTPSSCPIKLNNVDGKQNGRFNSHFTASSTEEIKCFFCSKSEECVATNGPKRTKIVQYLACKKFTEIAPSAGVEIRENVLTKHKFTNLLMTRHHDSGKPWVFSFLDHWKISFLHLKGNLNLEKTWKWKELFFLKSIKSCLLHSFFGFELTK